MSLAQLEELAINQTITVYALANALKSKDRLTFKKTLKNAERLVNIFLGFKGQDQVIQSLEAIEKTLLKDIERTEGDYVDADFGDPVIIDTYRRKFLISEHWFNYSVRLLLINKHLKELSYKNLINRKCIIKL